MPYGLQGYDIQNPASIGDISSILSGYASPDIAKSDIQTRSPQAYDAIVNNYAARTGDVFADPFDVASAGLARSRVDAISAARQAAEFGGAGEFSGAPAIDMSGYGMPAAGVAGTARAAGVRSVAPAAPVALRGNDLTLARAMRMQRGEAQGAQYQLEGMETQLPNWDPTSTSSRADYATALEKRANLVGAGELHREISSKEASYLEPTPATDILYQRADPTGKGPGKVVAGSDLQPIAHSPRFQEEMRRDPQKAKDYYYAVTGGRDYDSDKEASLQKIKQTTDIEEKAIEPLRTGGVWDPATGTWMVRKQVTDTSTGMPTQKEVLSPISDIQQSIIDKRGIQAVYPSADPSKFKTLPTPGGLTPEETAQYKAALRQRRIQNPSEDPQQAIKNTYDQLFQAPKQPNKLWAMLTKKDPTSVPEMLNYYTMGDVDASLNSATNAINYLLPKQYPARLQIPRLGDASDRMTQSEAMRRFAILNDPTASRTNPSAGPPAWYQNWLPPIR